MNELLDKNYGVQYPEEHGGSINLQTGSANCCKYNRWGTLIAVGSTDGRVFICDALTKSVAKVWHAHALPISSVSWSRDGRKLLTSSADTTVGVWDVMEGTPVHRLKYSSHLLNALFNPRNDNQIVVLPTNFPPPVEMLEPRSSSVLTTKDIPACGQDDAICAIAFDRRGSYIIAGTSKGKLIIYDSKTVKMLTWVKQSSTQQIRQIIIPRRGEFLLTNTQDRVIRVYQLDDLLAFGRGATVEPKNKVLDIVNKAAWKAVTTDFHGHYICGASTKAHQLYIWERTTGTLVKMLNGTKGETLMDVQWHPTRPIILSVSNGAEHGLSIWTQACVENWSAFAPDFTELEENIKYVEKEGEFDEEDEDASDEENKESQESDEEDIDIETCKPNELLCSSDEEDITELMPDVTLNKGPLWFLPHSSEVENPEQPILAARDVGFPPRTPNQMSSEMCMALGFQRRSK